MGKLRVLFIGIVFGVVMTKSEVISWYRIYEMFRIESFHMYGVIGSAVLVGILVIQIIKRSKMKSFYGDQIELIPKKISITRYLVGGSIFGFGWALTGACPGPMFTLIGNGFLVMLVVIASATLGTFVYGVLKDKLPH